jgi:transposase
MFTGPDEANSTRVVSSRCRCRGLRGLRKPVDPSGSVGLLARSGMVLVRPTGARVKREVVRRALLPVISAQTSKGRRDRLLPMASELAGVLTRCRTSHPTIPLAREVLRWPFEIYRYLHVDWHTIQRAARIPEGRRYVPKDCRSSCASELITAGVPTAVVKDFLVLRQSSIDRCFRLWDLLFLDWILFDPGKGVLAVEKYRVTLIAEERQELQQLVRKGKAAARKLARARVLLLADEGEDRKGRSDEQIAETLQMGLRTISRVRQRFVTEGLEEAINPRPQPRRPEKIKLNKPAQEQLIELACSDPPDGRSRWTLQLLADRLVVLGQVESISRETVRKALKKTTFGSEW